MRLATVTIHESQFPQKVLQELKECLRSRQVNHKFHYESVKQAGKWLRLHAAYSPSKTDPNCLEVYEQAFDRAKDLLASGEVSLIGLGCGGGQKEARLLALLKSRGRGVSYVPLDVSTPLVLVARQAALEVIESQACHPVVCDLAHVESLADLLNAVSPPRGARLTTFFGMIPNFRPGEILQQLSGAMRKGDMLLLSANLAPGQDYVAGVERILPLYDNDLTRDWLSTFLLDLGVERDQGEVCVGVEELPEDNGLRRVAASFCFRRAANVSIEGEEFSFAPGEQVRLFFSYRHTPATIEQLLRQQGLRASEQWITPSGEEGVFLVVRDS
jgi:L-histidine Nalpha-methyltransferase